MFGRQLTDEFDDHAQGGNLGDQRYAQHGGIYCIGKEAEHVVVAGLVGFPRPDQADAHGYQTAQGTHHGLALQQPKNHLSQGQGRGDTNGEIEVLGDDEQYYEHDTGKHGFHHAAYAADGCNDGEVVAFTGGGERFETGAVAGGSAFCHIQRTSENIGPRDSVVLTSVC